MNQKEVPHKITCGKVDIVSAVAKLEKEGLSLA
jgi:hypothetical protein